VITGFKIGGAGITSTGTTGACKTGAGITGACGTCPGGGGNSERSSSDDVSESMGVVTPVCGADVSVGM